MHQFVTCMICESAISRLVVGFFIPISNQCYKWHLYTSSDHQVQVLTWINIAEGSGMKLQLQPVADEFLPGKHLLLRGCCMKRYSCMLAWLFINSIDFSYYRNASFLKLTFSHLKKFMAWNTIISFPFLRGPFFSADFGC